MEDCGATLSIDILISSCQSPHTLLKECLGSLPSGSLLGGGGGGGKAPTLAKVAPSTLAKLPPPLLCQVASWLPRYSSKFLICTYQ